MRIFKEQEHTVYFRFPFVSAITYKTRPSILCLRDSSNKSYKEKISLTLILHFYRTRVRPLSTLKNPLTMSCIVNLIDVTLACEDANSKLVEAVTVANVDSEKKIVDDSLVQIWKLKFGPKIIFFPDFELKVWSRF